MRVEDTQLLPTKVLTLIVMRVWFYNLHIIFLATIHTTTHPYPVGHGYPPHFPPPTMVYPPSYYPPKPLPSGLSMSTLSASSNRDALSLWNDGSTRFWIFDFNREETSRDKEDLPSRCSSWWLYVRALQSSLLYISLFKVGQ